jgi:hypothetical protein
MEMSKIEYRVEKYAMYLTELEAKCLCIDLENAERNKTLRTSTVEILNQLKTIVFGDD